MAQDIRSGSFYGAAPLFFFLPSYSLLGSNKTCRFNASKRFETRTGQHHERWRRGQREDPRVSPLRSSSLFAASFCSYLPWHCDFTEIRSMFFLSIRWKSVWCMENDSSGYNLAFPPVLGYTGQSKLFLSKHFDRIFSVCYSIRTDLEIVERCLGFSSSERKIKSRTFLEKFEVFPQDIAHEGWSTCQKGFLAHRTNLFARHVLPGLHRHTLQGKLTYRPA